jgi:hypothetical protein
MVIFYQDRELFCRTKRCNMMELILLRELLRLEPECANRTLVSDHSRYTLPANPSQKGGRLLFFAEPYVEINGITHPAVERQVRFTGQVSKGVLKCENLISWLGP